MQRSLLAILSAVFGILVNAACGQRKQPEMYIERDGSWRVTNCSPPVTGKEHWCHALLCEKAHRDLKFVSKEAQLLEMRQTYGISGNPDQSEQIAVYSSEGTEVRAVCMMQGTTVLGAHLPASAARQ
jgi:hypothetical protein